MPEDLSIDSSKTSKKRKSKNKTDKCNNADQLEQTEELYTIDSNIKINFLNNCEYSENYYKILKTRQTLPVYQYKSKFFDLLNANSVVVIEGDTGSGKTTQIPQWCLEWTKLVAKDSDKLVCCTQPRRVAAMSVSTRVAEEMDVCLGQEVGYSIRFEDRTSALTRLKYMTDGMLIREMISDAALSRYRVIVLDEVHERTVSNDILMGLLKQLIQTRCEDLKLVVMSATLDTKEFKKYFKAPLLKIPGRLHEVQLFHAKEPVENYVTAAVDLVVKIYCKFPNEGDILVFLTGEQQIEEACNSITNEISNLNYMFGHVDVLPLYSALDMYRQQLVFKPASNSTRANSNYKPRKVIVSTNIAETSLTIDGVTFVVDCGFTKENHYDPERGMSSLIVVPISISSARQRAGRAGRTQPGKCFRIYTFEDLMKLDLDTTPEIARTSIEEVILRLLKLGVTDVVDFPYMTLPCKDSLIAGCSILYYVGAISSKMKLTAIGNKLAEMPLQPQMGKMLLDSVELNCLDHVLTIAAMLSEPNVFLNPHNDRIEAGRARSNFFTEDSDHLTLVEIYNAFLESGQSSQWAYDNYFNYRSLKSAVKVRQQLSRIIAGYAPQNSTELLTGPELSRNVRKALISGYRNQVAYLEPNGRYKTLSCGIVAELHPICCIDKRNQPQWIVYTECVSTNKIFLRGVSAIQPEWVVEIASKYIRSEGVVDSPAKTQLMEIYQCRKATASKTRID